ncbi:MAG: mechanosensitive ion channel [Candidatus Heimdallarchaeota archaeon]|nr:mechanosensitive ion channel [Candidatus Heimdallarchaeota archaeon]
MAITDKPIIDAIVDWFETNYIKLLIVSGVILGIVGLYFLTVRLLGWFRQQEKLQPKYAKGIKTVSRWVLAFAIATSLLLIFDITLGTITSILALFGGTILGFAAINTLGNAIAGIIIMATKPFQVDDRIYYKDQYADVLAIDLMYTKLKTLDNAIINIPNQELISLEIVTLGSNNLIRRDITVTPGYEHEVSYVEEALLEAIKDVDDVVDYPPPFVRVTDFLDFAVEYTLYYFINDVKKMRAVDAQLRRKILTVAKEYDIDLRTPSLLQSVVP